MGRNQFFRAMLEAASLSNCSKENTNSIHLYKECTRRIYEKSGYRSTFNNMESAIGHVFTKPLVMYSNNTYQFDDYSKYKADAFSEEEKAEHRKVQFPLDCQRAFELGASLI